MNLEGQIQEGQIQMKRTRASLSTRPLRHISTYLRICVKTCSKKHRKNTSIPEDGAVCMSSEKQFQYFEATSGFREQFFVLDFGSLRRF